MDEEIEPHRRTADESPGIRARVRYRFDNLLARGTSATLIWLGAVTLAAVLLSSLLLAASGVTLAGSEDSSWLEDVWQSMLRVLDPGTMASDVGWGRRLLALLVTIFGLLIAGTLIGIIAAGVEDRIESMRRGRSVVIESDHVVVLGSSDRLPVLLNQLSLASAGSTIVVLADLDPAEIHRAARAAGPGVSRRRANRVVYRSGDPTVRDDLALARLQTARAAIVLSDGRSDATAIETVLAIAAQLGGLDDLTVVVELLDPADARRLQQAFGESVHPIVTSEAVARTTAFSLRQPGLGRVLRELLDFRGSDLQLVERPDLAGRPFGDLVRGFDNARPIGLRDQSGRIELCPSFDREVAPGDRVVVVAEGVDDIVFSAPPAPPSPITRAGEVPLGEPPAERVVVIGWNELGSRALGDWAAATSSASSVTVLVDPDGSQATTAPDLGRVPVVLTASDDVVRDTLVLDPTTVVVLARSGEPAASDVRSLLTLQSLRREVGALRDRLPRFVVELHDAEHESLVGLHGPDDLIVSDAMGSQFIAQLVDEPARREVLLTLYSGTGATIRLVACGSLGLAGERVVGDLIDQAAAHRLLMIGWRRSAEQRVQLNPSRSDTVSLDAADELVVVG